MRDYTITKIRPGTYLLDLYANGNWVTSKQGTRGEVERYATNYINRHMPRAMPPRFIMT